MPPGGRNVCLLCMLGVVRYRSLPWADHSCRGFVPNVVFLSVVSPDNEEALACYGLLRHGGGGLMEFVVHVF